MHPASPRDASWERRFLVAGVAIALLGSAPADAGVLEEYGRLDARGLTPAPLVPTTAPRTLTPIDRYVSLGGGRRASGYTLRLANDDAGAIVALEGGQHRSMRALLREAPRFSFRRTRTRVRNRRGYLLTRRFGPAARLLAWVEDGRVYALSSGTPKRVSLNALRSTAAALEKLTGAYAGAPDPATETAASVVATSRTVTADVTWQAQCTRPGSTEPSVRVGSAAVALRRRTGVTFAFDIAQSLREREPWTGNVAGTVGADAITLDLRATGTFGDESCDTGPLSFSLARSRRRG